MNECNLQIDTSNPNIQYTTVTATPDGLLTEQDAAAYLGVNPSTLTQMREQHYGPQYIDVCGQIFYYLPALDEFLYTSWRGVNHTDDCNNFGEAQRDVWLRNFTII